MRKLLLLCALLLLAGCATDTPAQITGTQHTRFHRGITPEPEEASYEEALPIATPVLFSRDAGGLSMFEPHEGAYLGAWLSPETTIREFEQQTGKRHAVFVHELALDDDIPISWLLHCIASQATPLLIIHPPSPDNHTPTPELIELTAQRLGSFNLPMFIAFYEPGHGLTPAEYLFYFRYARSSFLTYAPMAAFVWIASSPSISDPFFPGKNAVDWIAVPLFASWCTTNGFRDILSDFETYYHALSSYAPLMVLPLGISHFARGCYAFRLREAGAEIERIYQALRTFPRLGLVVYGDTFKLARSLTDDFSITIEPELMQAYRSAIANRHFLSSLQRENTHTTRLARSLHHGYIWEDRIYINTHTLRELNITIPRQTVEINGSTFADAANVARNAVKICTNRRVIIVDNIQ